MVATKVYLLLTFGVFSKKKKKIIWWKVETRYMFWNYTLLMLVGNCPFKKITQFM
jgi:hypothetical protein